MSWTSALSVLLLGRHLRSGEDQLMELSLDLRQDAQQLHVQLRQHVACGEGLPACSPP